MTPTDLQPHNPESERQVIGALLIEPGYIAQVVDVVKPADFYVTEHRAVFEALTQLGAEADYLTVEQALTRMPAADHRHANAAAEIAATHGPIATYLVGMASEVATGMNAEHHAREVANQATRRRMIAAANRVATAAYNQAQPAAELLDLAMAELTRADADRRDDDPTREQMRAEYLAMRERETANKGNPTGIPSGLSRLDSITNGWTSDDLITVAGEAGSGKSTLMLQWALHAARNKYRAVFFSLEMRRHQIHRKLIANQAQINTSPKTPLGAIETATLDTILDLPLTVVYASDWTLAQIVARCHRERAKHGRLDLVVVDYLQIMNIREERGQNRAAAIGAVTRQLKGLGGKLDAAVMIGSQLNREGATRDDGPAPVPHSAMLKESGSIEQDSSMVLMLHDPKEKERNLIRDLYVRKNRMGEVGKVELKAKLDHSRFTGVETVAW